MGKGRGGVAVGGLPMQHVGPSKVVGTGEDGEDSGGRKKEWGKRRELSLCQSRETVESADAGDG